MCAAGPHLGWLLMPFGVGDCIDDVRNVGCCQRAYFRITCLLRSFWIRRSLVVWALPFLPNHRVLVTTGGSFHRALVLLFNVVASGVWPFFADLFGGSIFFDDLFGSSVFFVLERGGIMFAVTHSLCCHFLITCYCACATIPINAQVPVLVSYLMMDCLKLWTFSTLTRFKGI